MNDELQAAGKQEARLVLADEHLEDEDLLQMVNAGLLPIVIVDSTKADFWVQIFDHLTLRPDLAVRTGGEIAWAFRKDSPQLAAEVNAFIQANRKGTLMGNMLFKRYLKDTKWVTHALSSTEIAKFNTTIDLFRSYGEQYDFDHLMLAALAYQESRLDQSVRSSAGAIGVMHMLPSTASDPNVGIANIEELEPNIHAGTKYLRFLLDRYFKDRHRKLRWNADAHVDVTALQMPFQDATFLLLRQLVKNLSQMPPNRPVDFLPSVFGDKDNMVFAVVPRVR